MTVKEYVIKKNKILEDISGIVLVPENQITDPDETPELGADDGDESICPYCIIYGNPYFDTKTNICMRCPMEQDNNACSKDNSTYQSITLQIGLRLSEVEAVQILCDEYNKSNGYKPIDWDTGNEQ